MAESSPTWKDTLMLWAERALHVGLVFGAAYIAGMAASNPKYAWAIPAMQALGQSIPQPR